MREAIKTTKMVHVTKEDLEELDITGKWLGLTVLNLEFRAWGGVVGLGFWIQRLGL